MHIAHCTLHAVCWSAVRPLCSICTHADKHSKLRCEYATLTNALHSDDNKCSCEFFKMFFETLTLVCYIDPSTRYCHFCFGISSLLSLFKNFKLVGFISSLCYSKSVRRYFIFYNTNSNNIRCRFVCYCIMNKTHMILIAFIRIYLKIRTILWYHQVQKIFSDENCKGGSLHCKKTKRKYSNPRYWHLRKVRILREKIVVNILCNNQWMLSTNEFKQNSTQNLNRRSSDFDAVMQINAWWQ